ncbi:MAG TPA: TonB family protein [Longimicrobium sp.]|nr:TonB family protein [Longimicrobium sp.]
MIRILLLCALLVSAAGCTPPATVGAEAGAPVSAGAEGGVALLNQAEAVRAMDAFYDPLLRDAGVTGTAIVDVVLMADGTVREARVVRATHDSFRVSARQVARTLRFTPRAEPGAAVRVRMEFIHRRGEIAVVGQ